VTTIHHAVALQVAYIFFKIMLPYFSMSKRLIIDVREPFEYASGHVEGAINIPPRDLMNGAKQLSDVPKDTELILYCRSGSRSRTAAMILAQQGYSSIVNGINQDYVTTHYL
jgi:rhodanese-related sulfurtransferase